jgi:hypothetical protein
VTGSPIIYKRMSSPLQELVAKITDLATVMAVGLRVRGFKPGGTAGQVPVKIDGVNFHWEWRDGQTGPPGVAGSQGLQGLRGFDGSQGPTGPQGLQGVAGPVGLTGLGGPDGPQGIQGVQGVVGQTGSSGPQGDIGPVGPMGSQGLIGPQGDAGPVGPQGLQGPSGPQGLIGLTGPQGTAGVSATTDPVSFVVNVGFPALLRVSSIITAATCTVQSHVSVFWRGVGPFSDNDPEMDALNFSVVPSNGSFEIIINTLGKEKFGGSLNLGYIIYN